MKLFPLKKYPAYKPSGIDWIGEVPEHWEVKKLKYLAVLNPTKGGANLEKDSEELAVFLPMEKVSEEGAIDCSIKKPINELTNGFTYFERDDTIIAKITPCFENGKGAFLNSLETQVGFGSTEFHVIRPLPSLNPKWPFYLSRTHFFKNTGEAFMVGSAGQKRVPTSFLEELPVPVPIDLSEQRTITSYLDHKTALIDALIEKTTHKIALLQEQRTALINQAVTKGLDPGVPMKDSGVEWIGEVPRHWEVKRVKHLAELITGFAFKSELFSLENGVKLVRGINVKEGVLNWNDARFWLDMDDSLSKFFLEADDVLIGMDGSKVGKNYCIVKESDLPLLLVQRVARLRSGKRILQKFLFYHFGSPRFLNWVNISKTDPAVPHIAPHDINNFEIPLPPDNEQEEIVNFLDSQIDQFSTLLHQEQQKITLLKEYRQALISEVVTGKIDVRDA